MRANYELHLLYTKRAQNIDKKKIDKKARQCKENQIRNKKIDQRLRVEHSVLIADTKRSSLSVISALQGFLKIN